MLVKVTFELNDGSEFTESVKTPMNLHVLPPYYSVKRISWKKDVLYERDESKAEDWKQDLAENLEWLEKLDYNFVRYYNLSQPYKSFISKSALNKREFALNFLVVNPEDAITMINPKFKTDFSFVKDYIRKTDNIYKVKSVLELFPSFLSDVEFYKYWFRTNKSYLKYESYKDFIIEAKRDKEILQIFIEGADYEEVQRELNTFVLNTPTLIHFVESILVKCPEKSYNEELLASCENRQIAINILKRSSRKGFDEVNKTITVDKDFVLKVLDKSNSWNIYYANDNNKLSSLYFNPTLKYLLDDEDIKMAFMSRVRTTNKCQILAQYLSFTTEKAKSIIKKDEKLASVLLAMLTDEQKKELIDENPNLLISLFDSFINIEYGKKTIKLQLILDVFDKDMELVRGVLKCYYFSTEDFAWLIKNKIELLKVVPSDRVTWNLLKTVKDEYYILPYLKQSIDSVHILTDEEFMKEQAELSPDKLILKYCLPPRGTIKHRLDFLTEKKDFVLDIIKLNPKNIYDLPKKSHLWLDVDFAKEVIELIPDAKKLFSKTIIAKL